MTTATKESASTAKQQRVAQMRERITDLIVDLGGCGGCLAPYGLLEVHLTVTESDGRRFSDLVNAGHTWATLSRLVTSAHRRGDVLCTSCSVTRRRDVAAHAAGAVPGVTKRCGDCATVKTVGDFSFKNKKAGTRQAYCNPCARIRARGYYTPRPRIRRPPSGRDDSRSAVSGRA